ncbi:hypothetical protein C1H76_0358 [Elsinoe australis]|uniref:Uncharacterized protein n=1 Tax=Elsinoe australis TaxID=40998 RepID=A0A4U7BCF1_9PEZI|nr:hypothetical protein C1H76_0358 [Elsinoe australis]
MVYIHPCHAQTLPAYLLVELTPEQLAEIHREFGRGAGPQFKLYIQYNPSYRDTSHADIRRAETAAGQEGPFLLIDANAIEKQALWYVEKFANEWDVEHGEAESTDVLWEILLKTKDIPLAHANYEIVNITIGEDLEEVGGEIPLQKGFVQTEPKDYQMDIEVEERRLPTSVTVEPGEWEESRSEEDRSNFFPRPDRVVRLTEVVAKRTGMSKEWTIANPAMDLTEADGTIRKFPEDSLLLSLTFDDLEKKPRYIKAEGSL